MSKEDKKIIKAIEAIIEYKADNIKKRKRYIELILKDHGIEASKETIKVFNIGAVDAMIFDVGGALDFAEFKRPQKRKEMLKKLFPKK